MAQTSKTNPAQSPSTSQAEQSFSILPHPAKSNNPADLVGSGNSLANDPVMRAHHARDPHIPRQEMLNKLDAPLSREELRRRAEELNK